MDIELQIDPKHDIAKGGKNERPDLQQRDQGRREVQYQQEDDRRFLVRYTRSTLLKVRYNFIVSIVLS